MAKINWKLAPRSARWWAIDANGQANWYCAPNVAAFTDFWHTEMIKAPDFGFTGDWRNSLVERPAQEEPQSLSGKP